MRRPTILAYGLLIAAAVLVAAVVTGGFGASRYTISAEFTDASQLIKGNVVQIGGRNVGKVSKLELADDGVAKIEMSLDSEVEPLHRGTRITIRALGLSGVANRFVEITPGPPTGGEIPDGGVVGADDTRGVVDLDVLLNSVDEEVRADIQSIVADAAKALTPEAARQTNAGFRLFNPAVSQLTALGRELVRDQAALRDLVRHTASVSGVLAEHRAALGDGIDATADVLSAAASQRDQLAAALERAPESLRTTTATLTRLRTRTLPAVDPVAERSAPVIPPLGELLKTVEPTLNDALPLLRRVRALMPQARAALAPLPRLERAASPAVTSAAKGLVEALPVIRGLRPYTPELVSGFFSGFGGNSAHSYDANGHYARVSLQLGVGTFPGLIPNPPANQLGALRTKVDARCPGAAEVTAPDGSNPWFGELPHICDPADNHR